MRPVFVLLVLLLAAALEAGGDAIVRRGLHGTTLPLRLGLILLGAIVLGVYGVMVNLPPWDFGRLLGVYVALFFVMAQVINQVVFGVWPSAPTVVGGVLILGGGLVMTFWRG